MSNDLNTPSDWSATANEAFTSGLNPESLTHARKLHTTGTTCDAYDARINGVRVFIKKLKPEYAGNPIHLNAFRKEYEVGANLRHTSLPIYRDLRGDAIIMEYIDGRTLARMIQDNDTWFQDDRNIEKIMSQLLDVVDYLHQHGVVHCDLKPDNIMVTFGTGSVVLVDLDKSYTDARDLTPGTAMHYDLPDSSSGSPEADLRGLGRIAGLLTKFVKSKKLRKRLDVIAKVSLLHKIHIAQLKSILSGNTKKIRYRYADVNGDNRKRVLWIVLGLIIVIFIILTIVFYLFGDAYTSDDKGNGASEEAQQTELTIVEDEPTSTTIIPDNVLTPVSPDARDGLDKSTGTTTGDEHRSIGNMKTEEPHGSMAPHTKFDAETYTAESFLRHMREDVIPMNRYFDTIEDTLKSTKLTEEDSERLTKEINHSVYVFGSDLIDKYTQIYPEWTDDDVIIQTYDSKPVKDMFARKDSLLKQLAYIPDQIKIERAKRIIDLDLLTKLLVIDLAFYKDFLVQVDSIINEGWGIDKREFSKRIKTYDDKVENIIFPSYNKFWPNIHASRIREVAKETEPMKDLAALRDSVIQEVENL